MMRFKDEVMATIDLLDCQVENMDGRYRVLRKEMDGFSAILQNNIESYNDKIVTLENRVSELEAMHSNLEGRFDDCSRLDAKKAEHDAERKEIIQRIIERYKQGHNLADFEGEILKNWMIWD
jgi:DNA repair exonuclease SbcCD ATPase subunit